MSRWLGTLALFVLALLAAPGVRADEGPAKPGTISSANGDVVIQIPAGWTAKELTAAAPVALKLELRPAPDAPPVIVWGHAFGGVRNTRGRCVFELPGHIKNYKATSSGVGHEPVEHLWTENRAADGTSQRHLFAAQHHNRVAMVFVFELPSASWDVVLRPALEIARTATTKLPDNRPRPAGSRTLMKDGYLYVLAPGADETDLRTLHEAIRTAERAWEKAHGPVPKPPENPIEIVVHGTRDAANAAVRSHGGTPWTSSGVYANAALGILDASKLPAADAARAELSYCMWDIFHAQCFDAGLDWLSEMEARAAWLEVQCGRPLPSLPTSVAESVPASPPGFDELTRKSFQGLADAQGSLMLYLALFRGGPKPWRDAWTAFNDELRSTGDWRKAESILLALDQQKLQAAAEAYRASLKPAKNR